MIHERRNIVEYARTAHAFLNSEQREYQENQMYNAF